MQILPVALGFRTRIDAGLARVLFSWTLHAIVYFWLMPTYIGMLILTLPWHWAGLLGMPRRMAYFDYSSPALASEAWTCAGTADDGRSTRLGP